MNGSKDDVHILVKSAPRHSSFSFFLDVSYKPSHLFYFQKILSHWVWAKALCGWRQLWKTGTHNAKISGGCFPSKQSSLVKQVPRGSAGGRSGWGIAWEVVIRATPSAWGSLGAFIRLPGVAGHEPHSASSPRVQLVAPVSGNAFILLGSSGSFPLSWTIGSR